MKGRKALKTAIFSWFGYEIEMEQRLKLIKNAGFDSVVLWWGEHNLGSTIKRTDQPNLVYKHGLSIENVHFPYENVNLIWQDSINGKEYQQYIINLINECSCFNIKTAVIHLLWGFNNLQPTKTGLERIKNIVNAAQQADVTIAFENLVFLEHLDFVFNNISSEKIGVCFDSGHQNCFNKDKNILREYSNKIVAVHLHDNDGINDLHMIPFDGNIYWQQVMADLKNSSFRSALTLEVDMRRHKLYKTLSAEEFLDKAFNSLKRLKSLIK